MTTATRTKRPGPTSRTVSRSFGSITWDPLAAAFDLSAIRGIDADLVVRPFGRKGQFSTVRQFDLGALQFHFGMQPVEVVGEGLDPDGDGVNDEVLVGETAPETATRRGA